MYVYIAIAINYRICEEHQMSTLVCDRASENGPSLHKINPITKC